MLATKCIFLQDNYQWAYCFCDLWGGGEYFSVGIRIFEGVIYGEYQNFKVLLTLSTSFSNSCLPWSDLNPGVFGDDTLITK